LVEHLLCKQGVGGSSPLVSTIEPLEPSRDAKGSSYVKSAIAPSRTQIVWKNAGDAVPIDDLTYESWRGDRATATSSAERSASRERRGEM
jgi:hypothetical protein